MMGAKINDIWGAGKWLLYESSFWRPNTHEGDRFLNMIIMYDENRLWQFDSKFKQQSLH